MSQNIFGTDGIRTLIGKSPLTIEELPKLGIAIAQWAANKYHTTPYILIAHDTRSSCHFIKASIKSGLLLAGAKTFDSLALTTPAACLLTRTNKSFVCGIIITASHNTFEYNGLKIVDDQGSKISCQEEQEIFEIFRRVNINTMSHKNLGNDYRALHPADPYIHVLTNNFQKNFLKNKKIVLDCAYGATSFIAPHIFRLLGAEVLALHDKPDGTNINHNCGALALKSIQQAVIKHKADIGFAFDGDGDRVIAINRHGQLKNGDDLLALLMDHPDYKNAGAIVGTTFSNEGLAALAHAKGKKLIRTEVGDKFVSQALKLQKLPLGGEPSGHIIFTNYLDSSDGIFTALKVLEIIISKQNWDMASFDHVPQFIISIPVTTKKDLTRSPLAQILQNNHAEFPQGRFVIRYSGTEQVLRILAEAPEKNMAELMGHKLANQLRSELDIT